MIYLTGDTHASFSKRFNNENFPEQRKMTKDDYVIICGDFGGIWDEKEESKNEKYWLNWFEERNFTLLFVDGNHENYDRLYAYPIKEWHGGKVHEIRPSVLHLMRGQVFEIDGKSIFTFGEQAVMISQVVFWIGRILITRRRRKGWIGNIYPIESII